MDQYSRVYDLGSSIVMFSYDYVEQDNYMRWITTCTIKVLYKNGYASKVYAGASIKHPGEYRNDEIGRRIAFDRAVKTLVYDRMENLPYKRDERKAVYKQLRARVYDKFFENGGSFK